MGTIFLNEIVLSKLWTLNFPDVSQKRPNLGDPLSSIINGFQDEDRVRISLDRSWPVSVRFRFLAFQKIVCGRRLMWTRNRTRAGRALKSRRPPPSTQKRFLSLIELRWSLNGSKLILCCSRATKAGLKNVCWQSLYWFLLFLLKLNNKL